MADLITQVKNKCSGLESLADVVAHLDEPECQKLIPSGIDVLDKATGGLQTGHVILVISHDGAELLDVFARGVARNAQQAARVLMLSTSESAREICNGIIHAEIYRDNSDTSEADKAKAAKERVANMNILVAHHARLTTSEIKVRTHEVIADRDEDQPVIAILNDLQAGESGKQVLQELKQLAVEEGVAILALTSDLSFVNVYTEALSDKSIDAMAQIVNCKDRAMGIQVTKKFPGGKCQAVWTDAVSMHKASFL